MLGRGTDGHVDSALVGFLLSLTPLSCDLMGWRGAGGSGAASTGATILGDFGERCPINGQAHITQAFFWPLEVFS